MRSGTSERGAVGIGTLGILLVGAVVAGLGLGNPDRLPSVALGALAALAGLAGVAGGTTGRGIIGALLGALGLAGVAFSFSTDAATAGAAGAERHLPVIGSILLTVVGLALVVRAPDRQSADARSARLLAGLVAIGAPLAFLFTMKLSGDRGVSPALLALLAALALLGVVQAVSGSRPSATEPAPG